MHQPLPNQLYLELLTIQKIKDTRNTSDQKCDVETCALPPDYLVHVPQPNDNGNTEPFRTFRLCNEHTAKVLEQTAFQIDQH